MKYIHLASTWINQDKWDEFEEPPPSIDSVHGDGKSGVVSVGINRQLSSESAKYFDHPRWKEYRKAVLSGEAEAGFESWIGDQDGSDS